MECEQTDQFLSQVPPLTDDEWLLRLHFSPEHFLDGELIPAAISTSDLKDRGFSVDRERIVDLVTIEARAIIQQQKIPEQREKPYLSRFECGSIRLIQYENEIAFKLQGSPTDDNPAHAHILSAQKLGNGGLKKLRKLLLEKLQTFILLEQYIEDRNSVI
jgi:hypothetical protein